VRRTPETIAGIGDFIALAMVSITILIICGSRLFSVTFGQRRRDRSSDTTLGGGRT
jgi:hypothetical protein